MDCYQYQCSCCGGWDGKIRLCGWREIGFSFFHSTQAWAPQVKSRGGEKDPSEESEPELGESSDPNASKASVGVPDSLPFSSSDSTTVSFSFNIVTNENRGLVMRCFYFNATLPDQRERERVSLEGKGLAAPHTIELSPWEMKTSFVNVKAGSGPNLLQYRTDTFVFPTYILW